MRSPAEQRAIREDIFRWLSDLLVVEGRAEIHHAVLKSYTYRGETIRLMDNMKGIWNPRDFDSTLSITTRWRENAYADDVDPLTGFVSYSYQANDGGDNVKLVAAFTAQDPLVYFKAVREGWYYPYFPVHILVNDPVARLVKFPLDDAFAFFGEPLALSDSQRRYAERMVRQRLHQPLFRAHVLRAYETTCAICSLKHPELLDAAHIIGDSHDDGLAHVSNGLSLCKIHHAAYDRDLLGISPDYVVRINRSLLEEVDGPMLRHGIQEMHGRSIILPRRADERPSREALARRYDQFAA